MTDKKSIISKASTTCTDQLIGEFKALMHDAEALIHGAP